MLLPEIASSEIDYGLKSGVDLNDKQGAPNVSFVAPQISQSLITPSVVFNNVPGQK